MLFLVSTTGSHISIVGNHSGLELTHAGWLQFLYVYSLF